MTKTFLTLACLLAAEAASAQTAAPAAAVELSTAAARAPQVGDIYNGTRYRDPFRPILGGGGGTAVVLKEDAANTGEVSIHSLYLKGIIKDRAGAYAVLVESQTGMGYILRKNQLFSYKDKRVPGIKGEIMPRQKMVVLSTPDGDRQELMLGEKEEETP